MHSGGPLRWFRCGPAKRLIRLAALAIVLACLTRPTTGQSTSFSLADFDARLAETEAVVSGLSAPVDPAGRTALAEQARAWLAVRAVELPDGRVLPLSTDAIGARLTAPDATPEDLREFVAALRSVREAWIGAGHSENDLISLARILAQSKYGAETQPPDSTWLADLIRRFLEWFRDVSGSVDVPDLSLYWVIGLSIVLVALLVGIGLLLRRSVVRERAGLATPMPTEAATADEALGRADALAAAGDLRQAVRQLYLATLLALDEQGALRFDRALTNQEVLLRLRSRPELARVLASVIDVFDSVWYGEHSLTAETFATYVEAVAALRRPS